MFTVTVLDLWCVSRSVICYLWCLNKAKYLVFSLCCVADVGFTGPGVFQKTENEVKTASDVLEYILNF